MDDDTKEARLSPEEWSTLRIALDNLISDSRYVSTLNDEFKQQQEQREALQKKLTMLGLWESKPFTVVMRVEVEDVGEVTID